MAVACLTPFGVALPMNSARAQMVANCSQKMDFGKFAIAGGTGKLTITPAGSVPTHPNIVTVIPPTVGICKISGFTGTTGTLQIQVSQTKATITNAGNVLTVKSFDVAKKNEGRTKTYISASLTKTTVTYNIGATLRADGGDPVGVYTGSVIIIHTYTN